MKAMGSPNFVPDQIETSTMSYATVSYLKKLKNQVIYSSLVYQMCCNCLCQQVIMFSYTLHGLNVV